MKYLWLSIIFLTASRLSATPIVLNSPDGTLRGEIDVDVSGKLVFTVLRKAEVIIAPSRIGITVNGTDLGADVTLGAPAFTTIDETYPVRGGRAVAHNRANLLTVSVQSKIGAAPIELDARAEDDGFAWRLCVAGDGVRQVQGEASTWTLPAASRVWFFERNSDWKLKSYAGQWMATDVENLPTVSKQSPVQGTPLLVERAGGAGYVLISEAALANYSGLRLRSLPGRVVQADFAEGVSGFYVTGPITTPWRVTLVADDLNTLVNSDLITNLAPPPDPHLYADTSYIKPGRVAWRWWSLGTGNPDQEKQFVDYAAALGFEYTLVDDGWKNWPNAWEAMRRLTDYAHDQHVGVLIWKDYKDIKSPDKDWAQLRAFLDQTRSAGVAGVKIDFLNAETKDRIDFITTALRMAAERRLMVIFHGVGKPTGECRTWPNAISREGIRGLELNKMSEGPITPSHNAALPFTRFVVGPGDYTPLGYSNPGNTSWAHQLATFVQFTSPLQMMAEDPDFILNRPETRPALDVLKAIPSVWDETRILPHSAVGKLSLMARRSGTTWFLTAINGDAATDIDALDLSFLGSARYRAVELTSPVPHAFARRELNDIGAHTAWNLHLREGDGAVIQFTAMGQ